jgi:predicted amidophosphoribosyltransferase
VPVRHVLRRTRNTPPQAGLTASARGLNLRGAFAPRVFGARHVAGRRLVLLDDVSTTGATAGACAEILKQMGASEVRLLTVARTPRSAAR